MYNVTKCANEIILYVPDLDYFDEVIQVARDIQQMNKGYQVLITTNDRTIIALDASLEPLSDEVKLHLQSVWEG